METKKRDSFIDILKGIGIISVVIGHSSTLFPGGEFIKSTVFVYLYHLMIFFFAAGMTYNPKKYTDFYQYFGRQLKTSLPLFVQYNLLLLILHNPLAELKVLDMPTYNTTDFIIKATNIFVMSHMETLCGALWFVPMFLIAKAMFSFFFQIANRSPAPLPVHSVIILVSAYIGVYTNHHNMYLPYHMQTSILGIPILYCGYVYNYLRNRFPIIQKCFNPLTCAVSALLMVAFLERKLGYIQLSANSIISPLLFYPVTGLGIIFCLCLANTLNRAEITERFVSFAGSISFHIMAQHFVVFKLFDVIYGSAIHAAPEVIMAFPTAFLDIGLIYTVLGVALPMALVFTFRRVKSHILQKYNL